MTQAQGQARTPGPGRASERLIMTMIESPAARARAAVTVRHDSAAEPDAGGQVHGLGFKFKFADRDRHGLTRLVTARPPASPVSSWHWHDPSHAAAITVIITPKQQPQAGPGPGIMRLG